MQSVKKKEKKCIAAFPARGGRGWGLVYSIRENLSVNIPL